jgi:hypothetical protein
MNACGTCGGTGLEYKLLVVILPGDRPIYDAYYDDCGACS